MIKVFLNENNQTTVICPECGKTKTVDLSSYIETPRDLQFRAKCVCSHSFKVAVEKRKRVRKATNFKGWIYRYVGRGKKIKEAVTIKDVSSTGVKFIYENASSLKIGERLEIEFTLDDAKCSDVNGEIIVRNIDGFYIGAQFCFEGYSGKALGFYLLNS
jgi:hypothetical protein